MNRLARCNKLYYRKSKLAKEEPDERDSKRSIIEVMNQVLEDEENRLKRRVSRSK